MPDKDVGDMINAPETIAYRKERLSNWETLRARHADYIVDATKHGASDLQARTGAANWVRGDLRWLVADLLTHAPANDAAWFIEVAPRAWGASPEILLHAEPSVPELIARTFPITTWAAKLDVLTRASAANDQTWGQWVGDAALALGIPQLSSAVLGGVGDVASGLGSAVKGVGEGVGGLGSGLGSIGSGLGAAFRYLPIAIAAIGAAGVYAAYRYLAPYRPPPTRMLPPEQGLGVPHKGPHRHRRVKP